MKLALLLLALASCTMERPQSISERERRLMCTGPTEVIADNDPALVFFRTDEGLSLETRKVALAIERVNSCD